MPGGRSSSPPPAADAAMELYVETLTGTAFELRVSPLETIMSVKARIQRMEGIPVAQQHLVWQSKELKDDYCLQDYRITDGSTIKLVLALRGGPINTRRIAVEDPAWKEMVEYMEANREEIWEKLPGGRQVTLLVFRDGDQINFLPVIDRTDGTLSPLAESMSSSSIKSLNDDEQDAAAQERCAENAVTEQKMQMLRKKMDAMNLKKKPKRSRPHNLPNRDNNNSSSNIRPSSRSSAHHFLVVKPKIQNPGFSLNKHLRLPPVNSHYISSNAKPQANHLCNVDVGAVASPSNVATLLPKVSCADSVDDLLSIEDRVNVRETGAVPKRKNYSCLANAAASSSTTKTHAGGSSISALETTALIPSAAMSDGGGIVKEHAYASDVSEPLLSADAKPPCMSLPAVNLSTAAPARRLSFGSKLDSLDTSNLHETLAKLDPRITTTASGVHKSHVASAAANRHDRMFLSSSLGPSRGRNEMEKFPEILEREFSARPKTSPDKLIRSTAERRIRTQNAKDWFEVYNRIRTKINSQRSVIIGPRERLLATSRPADTDLLTGSQSNIPLRMKERRGVNKLSHHHVHSEGDAKSGDKTLEEKSFAQESTRKRIPNSSQKLPPVHITSTVAASLIPRCKVCKKKTGLATTYTCRCGENFCAIHRYAETHGCTFDYKTEGRRILEQANPVVAAPKLPKI